MLTAVEQGEGFGNLAAVVALLDQARHPVGKGEALIVAEHGILGIQAGVGVPYAAAGQGTVGGKLLLCQRVDLVGFAAAEAARLQVDDGIKGVHLAEEVQLLPDVRHLVGAVQGKILRVAVQAFPVLGDEVVKGLLLLHGDGEDILDGLLPQVVPQGGEVADSSE